MLRKLSNFNKQIKIGKDFSKLGQINYYNNSISRINLEKYLGYSKNYLIKILSSNNILLLDDNIIINEDVIQVISKFEKLFVNDLIKFLCDTFNIILQNNLSKQRDEIKFMDKFIPDIVDACPDLEYTFQKYVKTTGGNFRIDLYLKDKISGVEVSIEYDEPHHKKQKAADKKRTKLIESELKIKEFRYNEENDYNTFLLSVINFFKLEIK